jgi:hypothetical protein
MVMMSKVHGQMLTLCLSYPDGADIQPLRT